MGSWGGAASGAASGATAGAAFGPYGAAVGGIAGGVYGFFSGSDSNSSNLQPLNAPTPNVMSPAFKTAGMDPTTGAGQSATIAQFAQMIGRPVAEASKIYTALVLNQPVEKGFGVSTDQVNQWKNALSQAQNSVAQGQTQVDLSNLGQQQAIFGQGGSQFLNTAPNQQITTPTQALQQAQGFVQPIQNLSSLAQAQAGLTQATPEQQAIIQAQRTAALQPVQQQVASTLATMRQQAAARGQVSDPMAEQTAINAISNASQNIGLQQQLAGLNALPGLAQAGQQLALTPAEFQSQVQQAQAGLGAQQAQLGLSGFGQAGTLALGQQGLLTGADIASMQAQQQMARQQQAQQFQQTAAIPGTVASGFASLGKAFGGQSSDQSNQNETQPWFKMESPPISKTATSQPTGNLYPNQ